MTPAVIDPLIGSLIMLALWACTVTVYKRRVARAEATWTAARILLDKAALESEDLTSRLNRVSRRLDRWRDTAASANTDLIIARRELANTRIALDLALAENCFLRPPKVEDHKPRVQSSLTILEGANS